MAASRIWGRKPAVLAALTLLVAAALTLPAFSQPPLSPRHRDWLEKSVQFLITRQEREVFAGLPDEQSRDTFIETFWRKRDPTPQSAQNERLTEHQIRLAFADENFTLSRSRPGRFSERGRLVIQLGRPAQRQTFERSGRLVPLELWLYAGVTEAFLPDSFYVIFFRPGSSGDFRIWSPAGDGLATLIGTADAGQLLLNPASGYEILKRVDRELALAARRLIPGEESETGLQSEQLLAALDNYPDLAERYRFKQRVQTSYSFDILDASVATPVVLEAGGLASIHYAVEIPMERVGWIEKDDRNTTTFHLSCRVVDEDSREILHFSDDLDLDFPLQTAELENVGRFSLQGRFYLIPGRYHLIFEVENSTSHRSSSLRRRVLIPGVSNEPVFGSILFSEGSSPAEEAPGSRPFLLASEQYAPNVRALLSTGGGDAVIGILGNGAGEKWASWSIFSDGGEIWQNRTPFLAGGEPVFLKQRLPALKPGEYILRVAVGKFHQEEKFEVAQGPPPTPVRVLVRESPSPAQAEVFEALSSQSAQRGQLADAIVFLQKAVHRRPSDLELQLKMGYLLTATSQNQRLLEQLEPLLLTYPTSAELLVLVAHSSSRTARFKQAAVYYERALALKPDNLEIMSALAEVFELTGQVEKASVLRGRIGKDPLQR